MFISSCGNLACQQDRKHAQQPARFEGERDPAVPGHERLNTGLSVEPRQVIGDALALRHGSGQDSRQQPLNIASPPRGDFPGVARRLSPLHKVSEGASCAPDMLDRDAEPLAVVNLEERTVGALVMPGWPGRGNSLAVRVNVAGAVLNMGGIRSEGRLRVFSFCGPC